MRPQNGEASGLAPEVLHCLLDWLPVDAAAEVFDRVRAWAPDAPREASLVVFYARVPATEEFPESAWGAGAIVLLGCYAGDEADGEAAFAPVREAATPIAGLGGQTPYVDLQRLLDADYPEGLRYYWKAVYLDAVDDDLVDLLVEFGEAAPSPLSTVDVWHLGGAVADVPADATAFPHRDRPFLLTFEANWVDPVDDDANVAWAREGVAAVRESPAATGGYGNFPGFHEDPAATVFGANYDRLVAVKTRYDPDNRFRLNANVPPEGWCGDAGDDAGDGDDAARTPQ